MLINWDKILADLVAKFKTDVGMIYELNPSDNFLYLTALTKGFPEHMLDVMKRIPVGKGIAGETALSKKPVVSCNLTGADAPACARPMAKTMGILGIVSVPMFRGDNVVGIIGLGCFKERKFTDQEINDLINIGRKLAVQMEDTTAP